MAEAAIIGLQCLVVGAVAMGGKFRPAVSAAIDHAGHPHPVRVIGEHAGEEAIQGGIHAQRARLVHHHASVEREPGHGASPGVQVTLAQRKAEQAAGGAFKQAVQKVAVSADAFGQFADGGALRLQHALEARPQHRVALVQVQPKCVGAGDSLELLQLQDGIARGNRTAAHRGMQLEQQQAVEFQLRIAMQGQVGLGTDHVDLAQVQLRREIEKRMVQARKDIGQEVAHDACE